MKALDSKNWPHFSVLEQSQALLYGIYNVPKLVFHPPQHKQRKEEEKLSTEREAILENICLNIVRS